MCRWLAHTASWGVLSTRDAASGVFGGVVSVSDGFVGNATGRLLFYLTVRQLQEEEEEGWERRWWLPRTGRKVAILHGRLQLWIGSRRLQTQHTTHNTQHTTHKQHQQHQQPMDHTTENLRASDGASALVLAEAALLPGGCGGKASAWLFRFGSVRVPCPHLINSSPLPSA